MHNTLCICLSIVTIHLQWMVDFFNLLHYQGFIPPGERPDQFQVCTETNDSGKLLCYCSDKIAVTPDLAGRIFIDLNTNDSSNLKPYRKYNTVITASNDFGEGSSTGEIQFSKPLCVHSCYKKVLKCLILNVACTFATISLTICDLYSLAYICNTFAHSSIPNLCVTI